MTRQNFYKGKRARKGREIDEDLVVELVRRERRQHPRIGGRKLHFLLKSELSSSGISLGRDRLFEILRRHDLLVPPLPRAARTTDSRHCLPVFRNLVAQREATGPNQIWVSDITYVRTEEGFVYLALITDRYSRKVVGYHCGENLESSGCIEALNQATGQLPVDRYPIHHSDRGCQYCCHQYVAKLRQRDISISMTEANHCYENAHAERVNGILKQEYGLARTFRNPEQARKAAAEAVRLYNNHRPHTSLQYRTPQQVHLEAA